LRASAWRAPASPRCSARALGPQEKETVRACLQQERAAGIMQDEIVELIGLLPRILFIYAVARAVVPGQ
jgi:hypothetical protein